MLDRRPGIVASLEKHLGAVRELRASAGLPSLGGHYETSVTLLHSLRGEWDAALELCRNVPFELERRGAAVLAQALHATECELMIDRGGVDAAAALAEALQPLTEELTTPIAVCRARVARALGDDDAAIAILAEQRERCLVKRTTWRRPELLGELGELLLEHGRADEARDVAAELDRAAGGPCRFEFTLVALRLRALVDQDADSARAYLERATAEQIPFERARAQLVLGSLDADSAANLTTAYRAFDGLGAGPWRRRAANELRARGITVPRPTSRAGGTLTDTEARLVRLVRDGMTNKQIGTALHYSHKTVEVYLSRIYAKTSCSSRVELVRAVEEGTVDLPLVD